MAFTSKFKKIALGTAAAGMMAATAVPAQANDRYDRDHDGISAGEIIAGVAIIGGLAAILSSKDRDDDRYRGGSYGYDGAYYGNRYDRSRYGGSRQAVAQCVSAARYEARRYGERGIRITGVTDIDRRRDGYTVRGRLQVNDGYRNSRYDRRYGNRGYDNGRFDCTIRHGRVVDVDLDGIR